MCGSYDRAANSRWRKHPLLKAASKDEVVELTRRFLNVVAQGTCEIHQLYEMPTGE